MNGVSPIPLLAPLGARSYMTEFCCVFLTVHFTELGAPYSCGTVNNFVPHKRCLRAEALRPSRCIAPSDLRPLRKILDCGLP